MKRLSFRVAVALITFLVGVTGVTFSLIYRRTCQPEISISNPGRELIPFCDLVANPDRYNLKIIRVQAILIGYHDMLLYSPTCKGRIIHAEFSSSARQDLIKATEILNGAGFDRGNFFVNVILVGRLSKPDINSNPTSINSFIPHVPLNDNNLRLEVLDIEQATAVPSNISWPE